MVGRYPYFFIDIDALGLDPVLRNALLLSLGFVVIGYVLYGADRLLGRRWGADPSRATECLRREKRKK